ncbi:hypothetical protein [Ectopseudomonas alcaliphila]|uniref:hypothetical protein n=1 Tax=Ectopseudomonas alcaliphila TaxID=101564 RepID=UPI002788F702|nr:MULTISPECIES: hypothetical protein [Pseudomonas]MDP9942728.1 hypothetical protein [Pseudomonas sp. 3400]MDR7014934.1 hypothetical protein [Pseudomonas alcaliphila]
MKSQKKLAGLFALVALFGAGHAYAVDATISKSVKPDNILVLSNGGSGLAQFGLISSDFPPRTANLTKTLKGIEYTTTSYPSHAGEEVEMCYYRPYNSTPYGCVDLLPNSSGVVSYFNNVSFGPGAKILIRHVVTSGPNPGYPAGNDQIVIRFSY